MTTPFRPHHLVLGLFALAAAWAPAATLAASAAGEARTPVASAESVELAPVHVVPDALGAERTPG